MKLCLAFATTLALISLSSGVKIAEELTEHSYREKVMKGEDAWFIKLYAPWCGHCQRLEPEWEAMAGRAKGLVNVGSVDCTVHESVCASLGISGYPTIKYFPPGPKRTPEDYTGQREAKAMTPWILSRIPSYSTLLSNEAKTAEFLGNENKLRAVLLTEKSSTAPLWKALSRDFKDVAALGEVRSKAESFKTLAESAGVESFPAILVWPPEARTGDTPAVYDGKIAHAELTKYFSQWATPTPGGGSKAKPPSKPAAAASSSSSTPSAPVQLTKDSVEATCGSKTRCVVVIGSAGGVAAAPSDVSKVLKSLQSKYSKDKLTWTWMDGDSASAAAKALTDGAWSPGSVSTVVYNGKRSKVARGTTGAEAAFLDRVIGGDAKFEVIDDLEW